MKLIKENDGLDYFRQLCIDNRCNPDELEFYDENGVIINHVVKYDDDKNLVIAYAENAYGEPIHSSLTGFAVVSYDKFTFKVNRKC